MWRFLTGVKPPPQEKAKLSEADARYEKEKRKREPQKTWKDKRPSQRHHMYNYSHSNKTENLSCVL